MLSYSDVLFCQYLYVYLLGYVRKYFTIAEKLHQVAGTYPRTDELSNAITLCYNIYNIITSAFGRHIIDLAEYVVKKMMNFWWLIKNCFTVMSIATVKIWKHFYEARP